MKHSAIGIIPARGGSKRIPNKNIVDLGGKPLLVHSILSAKKSQHLKNRTFVSTEDRKIAKIAEDNGVEVINRPKKYATDRASTLVVLKHAINTLEKSGLLFDTVVVLQPSSPFRKTKTIDEGLKKLWGNWDKMDAVYSVVQTKFPPLWMLKLVKNRLEFLYPNDFSKIRGQDLEKTYEFDGVLYVLKKDLVKSSKLYPFSHGRTGYLVTGKIESIDIDDLGDLEIARALIKHYDSLE